MQSILAAFHLDSPDSLKRFLVAALGGIITAGINPLIGYIDATHGLSIPPVSDGAITGIAGLLATYIIQSGANSAAQKLADARAAGVAAAAALTPEQATAKAVEAAQP